MQEIGSEERHTDVVIEDLTDDYDPTRYNVERHLDFSSSDNKVATRNIYSNRVARVASAIKPHGRELAMLTASPLHQSMNFLVFHRNTYSPGYKGHHMRDRLARKQCHRESRMT